MFAEWIAVLRRTFKRFLADDCTGLAREVAYSAMLAFFPATAFLLGLLGVLNLYDDVQALLATVAPRGVITFIDSLQRDQSGNAQVFALVVGGVGAVWAASGAMGSVIKAVNRAYDQDETRPFWRLRLIAIGLVLLMGVTLLAVTLLIVFGGPLGQAIADKADLGTAFNLIWGILRWPIGFVTVLLLFGFVYALAPDMPLRWRWVTAGLSARSGALAAPLRPLRPLRHVPGELLEDLRLARDRGDPDALAELHRLGDPLRSGAELGARAARQLGAQLGAESGRDRPTIASRRRRPSSSESVRSGDWKAKPNATDFLPDGIWSPR